MQICVMSFYSLFKNFANKKPSTEQAKNPTTKPLAISSKKVRSIFNPFDEIFAKMLIF